MTLAFRSKSLKIACLLTASALLVIYGWYGAKNTPRDGWSIVKMQIGAAPMPGSGDRAYLVAGFGTFAKLDTNHSVPAENLVMVLVRQDRRGLFIPWLETNDLRMVSASGRKKPWQTGSDNPQWHETLRSARPWYAAQDSDWHKSVVAGIVKELAGGYPDHRIRPLALALEAAVLLAHAVFLGAALYLFHYAMKAHYSSRRKHLKPASPLTADFESSMIHQS